MNIVPQAKKSRKQYCSSGQDVRLNSDIEDQKTEKKLNYIDLFLLRKQFWKCFLKKLSRQYCLFYHSLYHGIIHFLHINCISRPICSQSQCVFLLQNISVWSVNQWQQRPAFGLCCHWLTWAVYFRYSTMNLNLSLSWVRHISSLTPVQWT